MEVITATELGKQLKDKLKLVSSDKKTLVIKNSGKEVEEGKLTSLKSEDLWCQ